MADDVVAPQGQAAVNSHTCWGIGTMLLSGLNVTPDMLQFLVQYLQMHGVANGPDVVKAGGVILGALWALYGRKNASAPITGLLKP